MRMSCNGCRVLRKGCTEDCILRTCIDWIKSPQSQANATLFLAKFYGRAGLINLINSGPTHLHPEIFRSLLYEACGRIINPVYGSAGLMGSNNWDRCKAAVEAVLQGSPLIMQVSDDGDSDGQGQGQGQGQYPIKPFQGSDIRHLSKDPTTSFRRVTARRSSARVKSQTNYLTAELMRESEAKFTITGWDHSGDGHKNFSGDEELERAPSHDSFSVETVEQALVNKNELLNLRVRPEPQLSEIGLELTLGLNPMLQSLSSSVIVISDSDT